LPIADDLTGRVDGNGLIALLDVHGVEQPDLVETKVGERLAGNTAGSRTSRRVSAGAGAARASTIFCRMISPNWLSMEDILAGYHPYKKDKRPYGISSRAGLRAVSKPPDHGD